MEKSSRKKRSVLRTRPDYCDIPIQLSEIEEYLAKHPIQFGFYYITEQQDQVQVVVYNMFYFLQNNQYIRKQYQISSKYNSATQQISIQTKLNDIVIQNLTMIVADIIQTMGTIDLQSEYYIYLNRIACQRYDPQYAITKTQQTLKTDLMELLQTRLPNAFKQVYWYGYLLLQSTILQLYPSLEILLIDKTFDSNQMDDLLDRVNTKTFDLVKDQLLGLEV
jgi:ribosomal protein S24E